MDPLFEYAHHWLHATALRLYRPFDIAFTRERVSDVEAGRPGFGAELRLVALDALRSDDAALVHKGIAALAVVGELSDCRPLSSVSPGHATAARTAIFEIEHRSPAG